MARVLITGGTGLVGTTVKNLLLQKGYEVVLLTRSTVSKEGYAHWDINAGSIDATAIAGADYIIHLAGAGVADKRWSVARKQEILDSRTKSSALLVKALAETPNKVKAVISASAIGWYGPDQNSHSNNAHNKDLVTKGFVETDPSYPDFLGTTCAAWEASIAPVTSPGLQKRLVCLRTGIVLSKQGGALKEFLKPLAVRMAAVLGNGKQMISWIDVRDLAKMFVYAIEQENLSGSYNAVAPSPVSNKTLTKTLASVLYGKFYITTYVPSFILKIMLGEMSIEVLKSTTVSAQKIQDAGFVFDYPVISKSLSTLDL
ncbi:MAG: TIGR01777 family oxidoreductase [Bacteroidetes bacterium]|nr:TIGR01777 family oxidoreductase [Bacteroidota bacterium]